MSVLARVHRVREALAFMIRDPGGGWLALRMLAWRLVLPGVERLLPLPRLVRLMCGRGRRSGRADAEAVVSLSEKVFATCDESCLERSLVAYRYLCLAGAEPRLVVAFRKGGAGFSGHAWVTVDGEPVHDSPALLEGFESLVVFAPSGELVSSATGVA